MAHLSLVLIGGGAGTAAIILARWKPKVSAATLLLAALITAASIAPGWDWWSRFSAEFSLAVLVPSVFLALIFLTTGALLFLKGSGETSLAREVSPE